MKRTLSILLAGTMAIAAAATAFAADIKDGMTLGADGDTGVSLNGAYLEAGENYLYPVNLVIDSTEVPLTEELLDNYSFKLSNIGEGESVEKIELKKSGDNYFLSIKVKDNYPAIISDEEYSLKLTGRGSGRDTVEHKVSFETGAVAVSDEYISTLKEGDEVFADNDAPFFTEQQLKALAELNGHKKVVFEDDNWSLSANVSDMQGLNLYHDTDAPAGILEKYTNNDFAFLNFYGDNESFTNFAVIDIDVSDYAEDFLERFYVYRYEDGKLITTAASYNTEDGILSISARRLSRFVITDRAITDRVVSSEVLGDSTIVENPSTGAAA